MEDAFCSSCRCERCKKRESECCCSDLCTRCRRPRHACCCADQCPRCRRTIAQCCCPRPPAQNCAVCPPPCPPPKSSCCTKPAVSTGYLLPKILCSAREWVRCTEMNIRIHGLPELLAQPVQICEICVSNEPPRWEEDALCNHDRRALVLVVEIPLSVTLRDAEGCLHRGTSEIFVRVRVPMGAHRDECCCSQWVILPAVRMVGCATQSCEDIFCVRLEANVEAYLVRPEAVCRTEPRPICPTLPLYPQPIMPDCCC